MSTEEARTWFIRILLLGGLVWIGRALLWFANPIYWNPSTAIDYLAVVGTSLMFLFLAVVLWALYRLNPLPKPFGPGAFLLHFFGDKKSRAAAPGNPAVS